MKKALMIITMIFILTLIGCNSNNVTVDTNDTNNINVNNTEDTDSMNNTAHADIMEQSYSRKEFNEQLDILEQEVNNLLDEFYEKPVVTDELLSKLYLNEQGYAELYESAKNLPKEEYQDIMNLFKLGFIRDGIITIPYSDNASDYYYTYKDGVYTINQEYYMTVEWSQNIKEDSEKDAFDRERVYTVINPEEQAYILIVFPDSVKRLIRII